MQPRNHAWLAKGIPKMNLQGSGPSTPETLQYQSNSVPKNRLAINGLAVVHRRLTNQRGLQHEEKGPEEIPGLRHFG
jgi:hypothetical protein